MPGQARLPRSWPRNFVNRVIQGDAREVLRRIPDGVIDCVVTSPPYWNLRAYPDTEQWWGGAAGCRHRARNVKASAADDSAFRTPTFVGMPPFAGTFDRRAAPCTCGAWYGQLGLEPTWQLYVAHLVETLREVRRVLAPHGSLWLNLGDSFIGSRPHRGGSFSPKQKLGLPWRVRFALNDDGWISRGDVVWYKPNALPSSVKDRVGTRYEMVFHLVKSRRYFFDLDAIRIPHQLETPRARRDFERMMRGRHVYQGKWAGQPGVQRAFVGGNPAGRNPGDVWQIPTRPFRGSHFATFPEALCARPILASCPQAVCRRCGQPRVPIRDLPAWYRKLLGKGNWSDRGRGRHEQLDGHLSAGRSVARPVGRIIGYRECDCRRGFQPGVVLDPFAGTGTTLAVARALGRDFLGIELSRGYCEMAATRSGISGKEADG